MLRSQYKQERNSMAKIIKVGSQNPTFTSAKAKKASSIQTHRNSNEATNPFKFTNFEGKTLPFEYADVFQGFKPQSASKLRLVASSVAGSMSKMKSNAIESIVNFVRRVKGDISNTLTQISEIPLVKKTNEILFTPIEMPKFQMAMLDLAPIKERYNNSILNRDILDLGKDMATKWNGLVSNISFRSRQKYSSMSVAELETHLAAALAEGGINE